MPGTFLQAASAAFTNTTSASFTSQNLGTASSDRLILVGVMLKAGGATQVNSVTVAGVSATLVARPGSTSAGATALYIAAVPSGTSGTVDVTFNFQVGTAAIALWAVTGYSATPAATATSTAADPTASLSVPAGGFAAGVGATNANSVVTWTGLVERYDPSTGLTAADDTLGAADPALSITCNFLTPISSTGSFASFTPVPIAAIAMHHRAQQGMC